MAFIEEISFKVIKNIIISKKPYKKNFVIKK